ncbi:heavy metal-binding domain-containing protein [Granulicoccus sp. GXG6511]|uniref:heavy metal-binding domain-containing protein n=1 Tax=Granulicoccus sp. GXG6511 TaxID=3381351 RepID=UPI003D7EC861
MSYGQNPYGQNPYGGQPQQQPYGQRPYGGQPQQPNPYGQPGQNPYGQPQQGQPNPYGQPGQNPYGQPQQNPYGGRPGQQGQNPYGQQPQGQPQNPYAQPPQRPQSAPSATGPESWQANQPPAAPESLAPSTPLTIAEHAVPVHTLGDDPESFIARSLGEVVGVALRPQTKDPVSLTKARQDAVSRMAEMAKAADADAVVGLRFDSNTEEIVAYGTAVIMAEELELTDSDDEAEDDSDGADAGNGAHDLMAAAASVGESGDNSHTDFSGPLGSDEDDEDGTSPDTDHGQETPFSDADATRLAKAEDFAPASQSSAASHSSPAPAADEESKDPWQSAGYGSSPYGQGSNPYAKPNPYAHPGEQSGQGQSGQGQSGQGQGGQGNQGGQQSSQGWPFS